MGQSSQSRHNHLPCREYGTQSLPPCVLVILNSRSRDLIPGVDQRREIHSRKPDRTVAKRTS